MQDRAVESDPVALLEQADGVFREVLSNVTPEHMDLPTVNDEWDVRRLINHVVLGNAWAAENVRTGNAPRPSGDLIGDREPVEAYAESADAMITAFREPGALQRMVTMPFGEFPAAGLAAFATIASGRH